MRTPQLSVKVISDDKVDGAGVVVSRMRKYMRRAATVLHAIMVEEASRRPDGYGGVTGAKDTGFLVNSIKILENTPERVVVGTHLHRAKMLAYGTPQPDVDMADIAKWAERKDIDVPIGAVWHRIRTRGAIPNPFHERTVERFKWANSELISEVRQ